MPAGMASELLSVIGEESYPTPLGALNDEQFQYLLVLLITSSTFFAGCVAEFVTGSLMQLHAWRRNTVLALFRVTDFLMPLLAMMPILTSTTFLIPVVAIVMFRGGLPIMWLHARRRAATSEPILARVSASVTLVGIFLLRFGAILGVATLAPGIAVLDSKGQSLLFPWVVAGLGKVLLARWMPLKVASILAAWAWLWVEYIAQVKDRDYDWQLMLPFHLLHLSGCLLAVGFVLQVFSSWITGSNYEVRDQDIVDSFNHGTAAPECQKSSPTVNHTVTFVPGADSTSTLGHKGLLVACLGVFCAVAAAVAVFSSGPMVTNYPLSVLRAMGEADKGSELGPVAAADAAMAAVRSALEGRSFSNDSGSPSLDVALQHSQALRAGDHMRRMGYSEENIGEAYPLFHELARLEDAATPDPTPAAAQVACSALLSEYRRLRSIVSEADSTGAPLADVSEAMTTLCTGRGEGAGKAAARMRRAWHWHRRQMIATLAVAEGALAKPELARLLGEWHALVNGVGAAAQSLWPAGMPESQGSSARRVEPGLWRHVPRETRLTLLGIATFLGGVLLAMGLEENVGWNYYLTLEPQAVTLLWIFAQAVFPAIVPLALLSRAPLAMPIFIVGMWKCSFPEITSLLVDAAQRDSSLRKRAENTAWAVGLLVHHSSAAWVLSFLFSGRIILTRTMMMLIVPLVVAHLGIPLLRYRSITLYLIAGLLAEAWFQVEFFAHIGNQVLLVKVPCYAMLSAHYLFIAASLPLLLDLVLAHSDGEGPKASCDQSAGQQQGAGEETPDLEAIDRPGEAWGSGARSSTGAGQIGEASHVAAAAASPANSQGPRAATLSRAAMAASAEPRAGMQWRAVTSANRSQRIQWVVKTMQHMQGLGVARRLSISKEEMQCAFRPMVALILCIAAVVAIGLGAWTLEGPAPEKSYVEHAELEVYRMYDLCGLVVGTRGPFGKACEEARDILHTDAGLVRHLPRHIRANYLCMTLAYPMAAKSSSSPPARFVTVTVLRYHRALGYGNTLRLQGYQESAANRACWLNDQILQVQDFNSADAVGSRESPEGDCDVIDGEYEDFKQYYAQAVGSQDLGYLHSQRFTMRTGCLSDGPGYIIRSDWEHHRMEVFGGSLADSTNFLYYTYWHWHSLFEIHRDRPQLLKSFRVFLQS